MQRNKLPTFLNLLGILLLAVGGYFFLLPAIKLRLVVALSFIILGTILQAKFERFDIYGRSYNRMLEEKIQIFLKIEMSPRANIGGRKVVSTILNLLGIPILLLGFYLIMLPVLYVHLVFAGAAVGLGIYLEVKFYPHVGQIGT